RVWPAASGRCSGLAGGHPPSGRRSGARAALLIRRGFEDHARMVQEPALDLDREFRRGVELFNSGEYFECHEGLEDIWWPAAGEGRLFLQSIIHIAVGLYHDARGNRDGAERQLRKGVRKLAGYLPEYRSIDTDRLWREAAGALDQITAGRSL